MWVDGNGNEMITCNYFVILLKINLIQHKKNLIKEGFN